MTSWLPNQNTNQVSIQWKSQMQDSVNVVKKVQSQEGGGQGDLKEPQGFSEEVGFWLYFMGKSTLLLDFFYLNTSRGKNVFMHV